MGRERGGGERSEYEQEWEEEKWVRKGRRKERRKEENEKGMLAMEERINQRGGRREEMKIRIFLSFYKILLTEIDGWTILEQIDN